MVQKTGVRPRRNCSAAAEAIVANAAVEGATLAIGDGCGFDGQAPEGATYAEHVRAAVGCAGEEPATAPTKDCFAAAHFG